MAFHHHVLGNGLTVIGESSPSARSVAVGFFVRTGARDETPEVSGVSHFLEHMVFKGTPRRSPFDVNRDFDKIGASYNAFTSEENTVFYAAILPEYLPQATDILADILRPSLRGEDFDMEKKVIIEEIGMYDDQPMWCAYDHAKKAFFADHPLGNSVLGTKESVGGLKRDQMHAYYDRRYVAPNITLSVAGNFAWPEVVALAERLCGGWPRGEAPRSGIRPAPFTQHLAALPRATIAQEHVLIISPAPGANDPLRYAADTLAMIIGDDSGSRYHWELVDPGLVESADMSFHDYDGAGAYFTSFSCEPDNTADNLAIVRKILRQVQADGITPAELNQAKSKILSRVVRGSERPMGRMQALGMTWTYLGTYRSVDDELEAYDAVSMSDLRNVLDRYPFDRLSIFGLGPLDQLAAKNGS
jgi:predicted Zn-dependent peptidase